METIASYFAFWTSFPVRVGEPSILLSATRLETRGWWPAAGRFVLATASHVHTRIQRERGGGAFNLAHLVPGLDTSRVVTRRGRKEEGWVNVRATRSVFSTRGNLNDSRWIRRQTEDGSGSVLPLAEKLVNNRPRVLISLTKINWTNFFYSIFTILRLRIPLIREIQNL